MATNVENFKIELLTKALYDTGNGHKVEEVNRILVEYLTKDNYAGKDGEIKSKKKRSEK